MIIKDWKRVFRSIFYFSKLFFITKKYDVVFVSSIIFNRGENGENFLFKPMIEYCEKNGLSYIVFEDPAFGTYTKYNTNEKSIPFDFITIIQIILRKIYHLKNKEPSSSDDVYFRELKLSKFVNFFFFNKFQSKIYITLIWNNVTLWRSVNPTSCIVDYQHAFIQDEEDYYMEDGRPPRLKSDNNVVALVHGDRYKRILIDNDRTGFYSENNVKTVGINKTLNSQKKTTLNNKKILFTLELTPDYNKEVNETYAQIVKKIINSNADFLAANNYEIIFRHHPRFTPNDCPDIKIEHEFVSFDNENFLPDSLNDVSLHMTFHSTSAFDAAIIGIPTIFIDMLKEMSPNEMFLKQYEYPCKNMVIKEHEDFKNILAKIDNKETYNHSCIDVFKWSKEFYHDFDETVFGDFLKDQISTYKDDTRND
tara:strand:- start:6676 stop:7941 length:1266 start_codon:yes stop_codon:yes gene_type:complete